MYTVKKKKSEKIRSFWHRHSRRHGRNASAGTPNIMDDYNPPTTSSPPLHPTRTSSMYEDMYTLNKIGANAKFSSDYERYMGVRRMNMERIKEFNALKANPANTFSPALYTKPQNSSSKISSVEQELLNMANLSDAPYPYSTSTYSADYARPDSPSPYSPWNTTKAHPLHQRTLSASSLPTQNNPLSPTTELERFRTSFSNASSNSSSSTSSITSTTSSARPYSPHTSNYEYYPYYDDKPSYYEQQHEGPQRGRKLSTEYPLSMDLRLNYPNYDIEDFKPSIDADLTSQSNRLSPVSEGALATPFMSHTTPYTPSHIAAPHAAAELLEEPTTTTTTTTTTSAFETKNEPEYNHMYQEESIPEPEPVMPEPLPLLTVEGQDGTPISLQEDLENLLLNLEEHFKRRPSGIPKAPPPSPADATSPLRLLEETIYPDFDFTHEQAFASTSPQMNNGSRLAPSFNNRRRTSLSPARPSAASSRSVSETSSPQHSAPSSPSSTQFRMSPVQSDSEYFTPPPSPPTSATRSNRLANPSLTFSPALPPPPPLTPTQQRNIQELDCQGNFPSPPPPLAFGNLDLQTLPYQMPPPDFDYGAFDFQGNRLDRANENENEIEAEEALHTSSFTTTTREDEGSTTISSTIISNTTTPSIAYSTVSTATTTTSTTAIPTTPTPSSPNSSSSPFSHPCEPTVIRTVSTITTAVEPETGHIANSKVTTTKVTHPSEFGKSDSTEFVTSSTDFEEGYLSSVPPVRSSSMYNLLSEIRNGKVLRKASSESGLTILPPPSSSSLPPSSSHPSSFQREASSALFNVLASRRAHISDDEPDEEIQEEDEDTLWV